MTDTVSSESYSYLFVQDIISKTTYAENLPDLARRRLEQLEKFVDSSNYRNTPMFKHKNFDGGAGGAGRGKPYAGGSHGSGQGGGAYGRGQKPSYGGQREQGGAYARPQGGYKGNGGGHSRYGGQKEEYDGGRSGFGSGYAGSGAGGGFSSGKSGRFNSTPNVRTDEGFQFPKQKHTRPSEDGFKRSSGGTSGYGKPSEPKDHEWVKQRLATTEKNREGIERHILAVRSYLNKLTDKTYGEMILNIEEEISHIKKIHNSVDTENIEHMSKVASHIFEIASMNKFYSQVYARLYKEIIQTHPVFASILIKKHSDFVEGCKNTNYINPDVNYDGFCKYNLDVEKKQATACFIAYLMNMELLEPRSVVMLLDKILEHIYSVLKDKECRRVVEDMVEMLFAMFSVCNLEMLMSVENYERDVRDRVKEMCGMKPKSFDGLTNKTLFRCMDILELIK